MLRRRTKSKSPNLHLETIEAMRKQLRSFGIIMSILLDREGGVALITPGELTSAQYDNLQIQQIANGNLHLTTTKKGQQHAE